MKKVLALVLALVLAFSCMTLVASAYTLNTDDGTVDVRELFPEMSVFFEDGMVDVNKDLTVDLKVGNVDSFTQLTVTVVADAGVTLKEVAGVTGTTASLAGNVVTVNAAEAITTDGTVATLTFTGVTKGAQNVVLSATAKNGTDNLSVTGSTCKITVSEVAGIRGDVNNDGVTDTTDLLVLKKLLAGLLDKTDPLVVYPNVDGDAQGLVDTLDLVYLKKMLAGLI